MAALNDDQLFDLAPAAFATQSDPNRTSQRYGFMSTIDALDELEQRGWLPVDASQDNPRHRDRNYVAHTVTLTHEDDIDEREGSTPRIILYNSHNGRTKLKLYGGLYRFVCANGLIVGDERARAEFKHDRSAADIIAEYTEQFANNFSVLNETIDRWSAIELSAQQANDFAARARTLRFGSSANNFALEQLLAARREEDDKRDLWSVYNILQENTVKGGLRGKSANNRKTTSRELKGVGPGIAFNDNLWRLAESFASAA